MKYLSVFDGHLIFYLELYHITKFIFWLKYITRANPATQECQPESFEPCLNPLPSKHWEWEDARNEIMNTALGRWFVPGRANICPSAGSPHPWCSMKSAWVATCHSVVPCEPWNDVHPMRHGRRGTVLGKNVAKPSLPAWVEGEEGALRCSCSALSWTRRAGLSLVFLAQLASKHRSDDYQAASSSLCL